MEYLDDEHAIQPDLDGHGARLDVLTLIDGEYVDVEMQVGWDHLPRRPPCAGFPRYELRTTCTNVASVTVDDGASTILLNASAWERGDDEVAEMLKHAQTGRPDGPLASDIAALDEPDLMAALKAEFAYSDCRVTQAWPRLSKCEKGSASSEVEPHSSRPASATQAWLQPP